MSVGDNFALYAGDGVTPVPIPQPISAQLERVPRGVFANGVERYALKRKLTWRFNPMSEAEYLQFTTYVPGSGTIRLRTWWPAEGATAGHFVDCLARMSPAIDATNNRGRYEGVTVTFTEVQQQ